MNFSLPVTSLRLKKSAFATLLLRALFLSMSSIEDWFKALLNVAITSASVKASAFIIIYLIVITLFLNHVAKIILLFDKVYTKSKLNTIITFDKVYTKIR